MKRGIGCSVFFAAVLAYFLPLGFAGDAEPKQVQVETKFVEVSNNFSKEVDTDLHTGADLDHQTTNVQARSAESAGLFGAGIPQEFTNLWDNEKKEKAISAPRVNTDNNKEAGVQTNQEMPVQVNLNPDGTTQSGVRLQITPTLTDDGHIKMDIKPEPTQLSASITGQPQVGIMSAPTSIIVQNGESIVLGGLIAQANKKETSAPLLSNIPVMGPLFKNKGDQNQKKDLLVFITPQILSSDSEN